MARLWSHPEIEDLVRGHKVLCCDEHARVVDVPGWIGEVAGEVVEMGLSEVIDACHRDDRGLLTSFYFDAIENAGEPYFVRVRSRLTGEWRNHDHFLVNLLHQDGIGAIVGGAIDLGPAEVDEDEALNLVRIGDRRGVAWIMGRLDDVGRFVQVQGSVVEILGEPAETVLGRPPLDFMHKDAAADVARIWIDFARSPDAMDTGRRCLQHKDGSEIWAQIIYINRLTDPEHGDVLMFAYDVTDRWAQEEALRQSHEDLRERNEEIQRLVEETRSLADQFRLLADEVPAAVFRCDIAGRVTFTNGRWSELVERQGPVTDVLAAIHPDEVPMVAAELTRVAEGQMGERRTLEVRAADGGRVLALTMRSFGEGATSGIVGSFEDVTNTVRLRREASYDRLTGLANRHAAESAVQQALEVDAAEAVILFVDLDGFKSVNDTFGHEAGDRVLQAIAGRLVTAVRPTDTVARYGGDEFVVVCRGLDDLGVHAVVDRLHRALARPVPFTGGSWCAAASIGAARGEAGDDVTSLVRRADLAMFVEKRRQKCADPARSQPLASS